MKRKLLSFNTLFLSGTLIFVLSLIPNRSEAQTLTPVFSDNFDATSETLATNSWFNWSGSFCLFPSAPPNGGPTGPSFGGLESVGSNLRKQLGLLVVKTSFYGPY